MNKLFRVLIDKLSRLVSAVSHELCNFEQRLNNKQTVEKLTKNNKYSQSLLNSVVNVIICLSPNHRIIEFNPEAERLYERKREEVLGKDYFELFLPEEVHDDVANNIKKVLAGEPTRGFENEIMVNGEKKRVLSWNVNRLLDSHGRPGGIIAVGQDITEAKHLEEQLKKLSYAVEQSPSTILITDTSGKIEYVNPKFTQLTGYTYKEAIGQNPRILKTGKTPPEVYECLWKLITSGKEWRGEFCNKKKNGELYWESASISPIKNGKGAITHFVAVKEDITKRKNAEEEIKGLAKFPDENPNPVLRVFNDGSILYHNKASLSLLDSWGCQTTRILPDKYIKIVSDVLHSGLYNVTEAECNNRVMSLTFAPIVKERYVNIYGLDITKRKNAEENIKVLNESLEQRVVERTEELREKNVELKNDITERKWAEKELRESEEKFRKITSSAYNAIVMMDDEGKVSFWNEAAEKIFGYSKEEVAGKDLHTLIVPDRYYDAFLKGMEGFKKNGTGLIINKMLTLPGLRKDGTEFPADHSFSSVKLKNKWHAISIMRDITERKRTEEQITASLEEKEALLDEVHHRVKNNLQIISSLLDMSSMQTRNQETIELFEELRNRVDAMALVHSQLYESERFDKIDMERHIQELSGNLLNIYSKEKTITLDIKSANVYLPVTLAVPCALVLNELISNSLKHAYRDGQKGTMSIIMRQSNDGITLLKVKDNGVGIPEEIDIERTKSLGLKLARNIVNRQLNGKMKVIRNKGAEFIIEFKNSKEEA